jgi:biopolymer transport protein TolR
MAMAVGKNGQTADKSETNVVPMIDIMQVLLIIFMIVTPLIAAGFMATLPKGKNLDPRPEGENVVVLGMDESGRYFLEGRALPDGTLEDQLRSIFAARTGTRYSISRPITSSSTARSRKRWKPRGVRACV